MTDLTTGLGDVKTRKGDALRATEADTGASVVTVAVAREFDSKAEKGVAANDRDAVIELEQAGDSALGEATAPRSPHGRAADRRCRPARTGGRNR